ncbi:MAG: hypothetical protein ABR569_12565 [Gaiellaceae bacterium]
MEVFDNRGRRHNTLDQLSPADYERTHPAGHRASTSRLIKPCLPKRGTPQS